MDKKIFFVFLCAATILTFPFFAANEAKAHDSKSEESENATNESKDPNSESEEESSWGPASTTSRAFTDWIDFLEENL